MKKKTREVVLGASSMTFASTLMTLSYSLSLINLFAVYFIIDYYKFGVPLCMSNSMISNPLSPAKRLMPVKTVTKSSSFINSILPNNRPVPKLVLNSTKFLV